VNHCWKGKREWIEETQGVGSPEWCAIVGDYYSDEPYHDATCLLPAGHDGPHDFTPDEEIMVSFAPRVPPCR